MTAPRGPPGYGRGLRLRLARAALAGSVVALAGAGASAARAFCGAARGAGGGQSSARGLREVRLRAVTVTDDSVPEAHMGLHGTLYGQGAEAAEAAHAADDEAVSARWPGRLDGSELLAVRGWLDAVEAAAVPGEAPRPAVGLFAVYGSDEADARPWHMGYSRRVPADLARLFGSNEGQARFARVRILEGLPRMWTRDRLEDIRKSWAEELGVPELAEAAAEGRGGGDEALSELERQALEERKWKMQLAMGQNLADDVEGEELSDSERRLRFLKAVEGDDWSAVIEGQTAETESVMPGSGEAPMISSPFAMGAGRRAGGATAISKELTVENVDAVLEALRPMLKADGGDIEVLGVTKERGAVMLGLLGACTSCPAAGTTMEDGIEKALIDHFGADVVKEIVRIDSGADALSEENVRLSVSAHLESLAESLSHEGATAVLLPGEAQPGPLEVEVSASPMLFQLVQSSLTYRFPELAGRLRVRQATEVEA